VKKKSIQDIAATDSRPNGKAKSGVAEGTAQHLIDSRRLFYFYHVARLGSLTTAEAYLDIAQSAISRQLQQLESDLGVQLLERTGRGVSLTEVGRVVFDKAKGILDEMSDTRTEIELSQRRPQGQISFAAPSMFVRGFMGQVVRRFVQRYPQVRLRVIEAATGQVAELVAASVVDLGIVVHAPNSPKVETEPLLVEHMDLAMRASDPLARRKSMERSELNGLPFILPVNPHGARFLMERYFAAGGIVVDNRIELDSMTLQKQVVGSLPYYTLLARGDCVPEDGIANVPLVPPLERTSYLARLRDRGDQPMLEPFIEELRKAVKDLHPDKRGRARPPAPQP
jgi:LysR family nitrogen assimilation transcriptional regulator